MVLKHADIFMQMSSKESDVSQLCAKLVEVDKEITRTRLSIFLLVIQNAYCAYVSFGLGALTNNLCSNGRARRVFVASLSASYALRMFIGSPPSCVDHREHPFSNHSWRFLSSL